FSMAGVLFISFISSCGKGAILLPASNTLYQVINLSPDLLPVDLYIDRTKKNTTPFIYANPSGYFALTSLDPPFQIRSASILASTDNLISIPDTLHNNVRYTLFITGLRNAVRAQDTVSYILTTDTAAITTVGRGKVRFVNASPGATMFDVTANGTLAFSNIPYKKVSPFIELPPGNYDFKAYPNGSPTNILSDLTPVTVQDGKIYTLYCRGVVGRTDSAAYTLAILNNN
ncbi:MAG TPA: DUF4397 domain-containing protein, partial [Mucilaginibacter sp.]